MTNFYKISTTDFHPISHNDVYLFKEYNKIRDFLISKNQKILLNVLAIPSQQNRNIFWSADTNSEVKKLDEYIQNQQDKILSKYNDFLISYNSFTDNLKSSKNQDNKNWGNLLCSLIEGSANELFFDGNNIFITWGWRLLDEDSKPLIPVYIPKPNIENELDHINEEKEDVQKIEEVINQQENPIDKDEKLSWLDRLYFFFMRQWWIIPFLSLCILLVLILER